MDIPTFIGHALILSGFCTIALLLSHLTKVDNSLSALLTGVIASWAVPYFGWDTGIRASNIKDLVFYIILPILVFEAAWHIRPSVLKHWLKPILFLATIGVGISCVIVAAISFYAIGYSAAFPWIAALLTGAILASTDPVAVVAALRRQDAPEDLATLIEGESLFNDATAVVLFSVLLSFALAGQAENNSYLLNFLWIFFGGLIVGGISGLIAAIVALALKDRSASNVILILLAFTSFYIAEHHFHVSGIMSVMMAAIVSKWLLHEHEELILKDTKTTWAWLGLLFNTLIFVLMGLVLVFDMFKEHWLSMLIAIVATLIARVCVVGCVGQLSKLTTRPISIGWQYILFWGGLRGAIAIALVLSLPTDLPYWWIIQSMVFGVVFFTLIIQGTSVDRLIKKYAKNSL